MINEMDPSWWYLHQNMAPFTIYIPASILEYSYIDRWIPRTSSWNPVCCCFFALEWEPIQYTYPLSFIVHCIFHSNNFPCFFFALKERTSLRWGDKYNYQLYRHPGNYQSPKYSQETAQRTVINLAWVQLNAKSSPKYIKGAQEPNQNTIDN